MKSNFAHYLDVNAAFQLGLSTERKGAHLRLKVSFLWSREDVCRGDVQVQEDLSEGRPVSWLAVPVNKCFVRNVRGVEDNGLSSLMNSSLSVKYSLSYLLKASNVIIFSLC